MNSDNSYLTKGQFEVRLAQNKTEIEQSQALRYQVFYQENGAIANENIKKYRRDIDNFDDFSDHLLVIDNNKNTKLSANGKVVGTYRLMQKANAQKTNETENFQLIEPEI